MDDLGQIDLDAEAERRFKMVYVPNWFSIDLKTGVSWPPLRFVSLSISGHLPAA